MLKTYIKITIEIVLLLPYTESMCEKSIYDDLFSIADIDL